MLFNNAFQQCLSAMPFNNAFQQLLSTMPFNNAFQQCLSTIYLHLLLKGIQPSQFKLINDIQELLLSHKPREYKLFIISCKNSVSSLPNFAHDGTHCLSCFTDCEYNLKLSIKAFHNFIFVSITFLRIHYKSVIQSSGQF